MATIEDQYKTDLRKIMNDYADTVFLDLVDAANKTEDI
jgi:hypothetical protein